MIKKLLFPVVYLVANALSAQVCGNLNFEAGNLGGWTLTSGFNSDPFLMTGCCITVGSSAATVVTTPYADPLLITLPTSPFGGTKVARIGDGTNNVWVTRAEYTMAVTGNILQYAIAPFAFNPSNHTCNIQNYNTVRVKDQSLTPFHTNQFIASGTTGTCTPLSNVYTYSASFTAFGCWSTYSVNVGPYIGQTITVEVTSGACTGAGHWAYCYFDAVCSAITPTMLPCGIAAGINPFVAQNEISLWPNPVLNTLHLNLNSNSENSQFVVYDLLGNEVMKQNELKEINSFNTSNLSQGAYIYKVIMDNKTAKAGKFIKE